jgi:hypothetical protein
MATDVYHGSSKIGWVSTSGEVFYDARKVGWVNGNGDVYLNGIPYGWVTRAGNVLDRRLIQVGYVDSTGHVYKGVEMVGKVDNASNRYYVGGAALLLLLGRFTQGQPASHEYTDTHEPVTA